MLSEETVAKTDSNFVNIIQAPMNNSDNYDDQYMMSANSNDPLPMDDMPGPSVGPYQSISGRRQRSGSDIFEMTRPKITTLRQTFNKQIILRENN